MFRKPLADLSSLDTSTLNDTLTQVKEGEFDLGANGKGAATRALDFLKARRWQTSRPTFGRTSRRTQMMKRSAPASQSGEKSAGCERKCCSKHSLSVESVGQSALMLVDAETMVFETVAEEHACQRQAVDLLAA